MSSSRTRGGLDVVNLARSFLLTPEPTMNVPNPSQDENSIKRKRRAMSSGDSSLEDVGDEDADLRKRQRQENFERDITAGNEGILKCPMYNKVTERNKGEHVCRGLSFFTGVQQLEHCIQNHGEFSCPTCLQKLQNDPTLIRTTKLETVFYADRAGTRQHILSIHWKPFFCCKSIFSSTAKFITHLKTSHGHTFTEFEIVKAHRMYSNRGWPLAYRIKMLGQCKSQKDLTECVHPGGKNVFDDADGLHEIESPVSITTEYREQWKLFGAGDPNEVIGLDRQTTIGQESSLPPPDSGSVMPHGSLLPPHPSSPPNDGHLERQLLGPTVSGSGSKTEPSPPEHRPWLPSQYRSPNVYHSPDPTQPPSALPVPFHEAPQPLPFLDPRPSTPERAVTDRYVDALLRGDVFLGGSSPAVSDMDVAMIDVDAPPTPPPPPPPPHKKDPPLSSIADGDPSFDLNELFMGVTPLVTMHGDNERDPTFCYSKSSDPEAELGSHRPNSHQHPEIC
ncbi:hypothetical protein FN846DRAFT_962377 [Sphaerosporella brunnea]|uniref:Uncharacterized protein n=1 Tax=Sphaerosporella brunnea TaxID=1250544 RepID=A0A5J5EP88_9PEZI|nr:hypothetical protein FN846DRAFT_962377 [Sphaerosporella brunnea]